MPQMGIFALGTASHAYLELDLHDGADPRELVGRLADLREPRTTIGGVNLVVGVRPELWRDRIGVRGARRPARLRPSPSTGPDGFTMPATQHDAAAVARGRGLRRRLRRSAPGHRGARAGRVGRHGDVELALPPRPRPDRLHRRDGEPEPRPRARRGRRARPAHPVRAGPCCCCSAGGTTSAAWEALAVAGQEAAMGRTEGRLDRARRPARRTRTSPAPTRTTSRRRLPPEHALRHRDGARDDVRRLRRRAGRRWPRMLDSMAGLATDPGTS